MKETLLECKAVPQKPRTKRKARPTEVLNDTAKLKALKDEGYVPVRQGSHLHVPFDLSDDDRLFIEEVAQQDNIPFKEAVVKVLQDGVKHLKHLHWISKKYGGKKK